MDYALITGASSGIGKALAMELAVKGYDLALVARSSSSLIELKNHLEKIHPVEVKILAIDLLGESSADRITNWIKEENINLGLLINNAAMAIWGRTDHIKFDGQINMIKLNIVTVFSLCYKLLPALKTAKKPHILNVVGTGAFQPVPYFSVYAASKAFVLSFSRSLRHELRGTGVNVSCLCHGPTDTDFFSKAGFNKPGSIANHKTVKMNANHIARIAIEGLFSKKALITPGLSNKIGLLLSKCLPTNLMVRIGSYLFR